MTAGYSPVHISFHVVKDVRLGAVDSAHRFGDFSSGSTILPPNSLVTIQYKNNHPQDARLSVYLEMGYGSQNLGTL